jgi:hypothetical protein
LTVGEFLKFFRMIDVASIVGFVQISLYGVIILLALAYYILITLIRQFHHRINIFTVNVAVAALCCSLYWMIFYIMTAVNVRQLYAVKYCSLLIYAQMMCTLQLSLALIVVSIHRLCSIVYHTKIFFKSRKWVIMCVACQWISGIVVSLPLWIRDPLVSILFQMLCAEDLMKF